MIAAPLPIASPIKRRRHPLTECFMASTFILPAFSVQPSFPDVIDDVQKGRVPEDTFWMSYFPESEPNVHAKVRTTLDEVDRDLVRFKVEDSDFEFGSSAGVSLCVLFSDYHLQHSVAFHRIQPSYWAQDEDFHA